MIFNNINKILEIITLNNEKLIPYIMYVLFMCLIKLNWIQ
jgi:hypothetical protein